MRLACQIGAAAARAPGPGATSRAAGGAAASGPNSASTLPPKPPPTIRAPAAPASRSARTVVSTCGVEVSNRSRRLAWLSSSKAPSAIVNVASTAARVARAGTGAYSASKFALAGWSDSLYAEELPHGVHVGLVLPGFIATEGFPQSELVDNPRTRWIVSTPERAAEAIYEAGIGRRAERYVPRPYGIIGALRTLVPGLVRRVTTAGAAQVMTTTTGADLAERRNGDGDDGRAGAAASAGPPSGGTGRSPTPPGAGTESGTPGLGGR